ncbi:hypothetical protein CVIRNUC_009822 [Coccomyxa viridis]|uniref:Asl1-like glycosyl hydrolase catalytic domain-containing protein n=1 Tax=Coccomyxa viridis TaxID=1274662 RepID=A0AAV1IH24_9CHLO|nr:hypothetical protein CVIRNUC_009822 [Coccomyxa viridis]
MRAICAVLLALLHCSVRAWAQSPNCTSDAELALLYKVFAQNENAFITFLNLLPAPTEARVKSLYLAWLEDNENQIVTFQISSPRLAAVAQADPFAAVTASCGNASTIIPPRALAAAPAPVSAPPAPAQAPAPEPNAAQAPAPAPFALAAPLAALINPKKGAGLMNFGNVNAALGDARLAWTYNWWYSLGIALPPGTHFIPMIFRASDATEANLKAAKSVGAGIVLGFNEPNEKAQADNTVAEAIAAWPAMMGSGLRLGSPAVSVAVDGTTSSSWIGQFMQQVEANKYKVDFMTIHWYGDSRYFSNPKGATAALKAYLEGFFKGYGRPVWLTEWALADFGGASNNWAWTFPTYAQQVAFMEQAVPMLDALGFVERYAWYFLSPDQAYDGHNGLPLDTTSLYLMNGSATPTGQAYSSF